MDEPSIFAQALDLTDPAERAAFLDRACGGDAALRSRVERLLERHHAAGDFLERPAGSGRPAEPAADTGRVIGPYRLLEVLGEGGMGTVWVAEQTEPVRRRVALKVVKAGMDSRQVLARFEAERQALALMDHPNIARVFDGGLTPDGRPFFVMELVKGVPITKFCDDRKLTPRERLELFVPVCLAIQHAHQKGVIHRDVKPSNVLVSLFDDRPAPKVIDFGVAKAVGQPLTEHSLHTGLGAVVGTVEYMSPEQAAFDQTDVDTRSDVYSLGVLLYELLTGTPPFTRKELDKAGAMEMFRVIREREPAKPSTRLSTADGLPTLAANRGTEPRRLAKELRGELDWIVMKALEKDRTRRYETANGFARDVQRYLADEPVAAGPPSAWYRARKFARRNARPLAAAGVAVAALLAGSAGATWGLFRALRAEAAAGTDRDRAVAAEADSEAFAGFVTDHVLAASRPNRGGDGLGKDVTLADALEVAERKLDGAFVGRPRAEAKARHVLGLTWQGLGRYPRAEGHLRRALALREKHLGPDSREALATRSALAHLLVLMRRADDARAEAEETHARQAAAFGPSDPDTLTTATTLGSAFRSLKKYDDALRHLEPALATRRADPGPDHPETLATMTVLGTVYHDLKRSADAIGLFEHVHSRRMDRLGPDHPDTLIATTNLAVAYRAAGRPADLVRLHEQVYDASLRVRGADHPESVRAANNLALTYHDVDRIADAVPHYRRVLAWREASYGQSDAQTLASMNNLALALHDLDRVAEALPLYQTIYDRRTAVLGPDAKDTLAALFALAIGLHDAGRSAEAVPMFERLLAKRRADPGPASDLAVMTASRLGEAYRAVGRAADAEVSFRASLAHFRAKSGATSDATHGELARLAAALLDQQKWKEAEALLRESVTAAAPDGWRTHDLRSLLGAALTGQARFAEAEPLLLDANAGLTRLAGKIPPEFRRSARLASLDRLVKLHDTWGRRAEADKWRAERAAFAGEQPAPAQPGARPVAPPPRPKS